MLNLIKPTVTLIYAISMIYILLDCEIKHKKDIYLIGLFTSIVLINAGFVLIHFGYKNFLKLYPLLIHIPSFIIFLFISKYKGIKLFFIILTVFVFCLPPIGIGYIVSSFFQFNKVILYSVTMLMYPPAWFIVYKYLRPLFLYMLRNTEKGWFGFCTIPIFYYVLTYFVAMYNLNNTTFIHNLVILWLALLLTLSSYIMILRFFKQTKEQIDIISENNLLQIQVSAAKTHFESLKNSQEKTIIYNHDMKHHLNLINSYLIENNISAANKHIINIEEDIINSEIKSYCSNYTVNLILSSYLERAKNEGIIVKTQINLTENNRVSDMDLCIIFSNAIENAINACKHISCVKDRKLDIVTKIKNNKTFIEITNSFENEVIFLNNIPINKDENHGIGTKSILAIIEKYGGVSYFKAENRIFTLNIIL